jgi:bacillithiol synthase
MHTELVDFSETECFDSLFIDYVAGNASLAPFYGNKPEIAAFEEQIRLKSTFSQAQREILVHVLEQQYQSIENRETVQRQLQLLEQPTTFTITTGHQLNVYTGPLYFLYKIITVIKAAKLLKQAYPDCHFIPVYWMATEDHDLAEISSLWHEGRKLQWQSNQLGAVGRMPTDGLAALAASLPAAASFMKEAYQKADNLADAVRTYVHHLFGEEGLIVLDADDSGLKQSLIPVIKDDLQHHSANKLVDEQSTALAKLGYKVQGFPREINFFYLDHQLRERIVREGNSYRVMNTDLQMDEQRMMQLVEAQPERFSPNVMLRPLYQEMILPNLSYTGGPAEVAYWLQLKPVFELFKVPFPILLPRNFAMLISPNNARKIAALGLGAKAIFKPTAVLEKQIVTQNSKHTLHTLAEQEALVAIFEQLKERVEGLDYSLGRTVAADMHKAKKALQRLETKMIRAEKRQQHDRLAQLHAIKQSLFPSNGLQERKENFLSFYAQEPELLKKLAETFDPFLLKFYLIYLHE